MHSVSNHPLPKASDTLNRWHFAKPTNMVNEKNTFLKTTGKEKKCTPNEISPFIVPDPDKKIDRFRYNRSNSLFRQISRKPSSIKLSWDILTLTFWRLTNRQKKHHQSETTLCWHLRKLYNRVVICGVSIINNSHTFTELRVVNGNSCHKGKSFTHLKVPMTVCTRSACFKAVEYSVNLLAHPGWEQEYCFSPTSKLLFDHFNHLNY